jgi:hypothetical protein
MMKLAYTRIGAGVSLDRPAHPPTRVRRPFRAVDRAYDHAAKLRAADRRDQRTSLPRTQRQ